MLGISYAGVASIGELPSQIPVTVRATDAGGATVSATFTVYPTLPQMTIDSWAFNNVIPRQAITVSLNLERLPPGVSVTPLANRVIENLTVAETNCYFLTNSGAASKTADLSGRVGLDIEGSFGVSTSSSAALGSCTFAMEFSVGGFGIGAHMFFSSKATSGYPRRCNIH